MTKRIIPYILFVAGTLTACQADHYEPVNDGAGEALTLTVTASDIVAADGASSRAVQEKEFTTFEVGDSVGLIILDKEGNLLVDNVPYIYDGAKWNIDKGVLPIYFDGTMDTYIVYYPYHKSVDGCKSKDEINDHPTFAIQDNQSTKEAYRWSDPMAWVSTGKAMRNVEAELTHLRNCFCLDPKIKCKLNNGETIKFRPKRYLFLAEASSAPKFQCETTGFEEFKIEKDGEKLIDYDIEKNPEDIGKLYMAEDGSYRYILPKEEKRITLKWRYYYRGKTYGGGYTVEPREDEKKLAGRRFMFDETADIGDFSDKDRKEGEKILQVGDYFCHDDRTKVGYPFPWEAVDFLDKHPCIGVIFRLGLHSTEDASKEANVVYTDAVYANNDHGYVLALTDAPDEDFNFQKLEWRIFHNNNDYKDPLKNPNYEIVGPYTHSDNTTTYWSGYKYLSAIRDYVKRTWPDIDDEVRWRNFPAAYACEKYGNRIPAMAAPRNTSGWFFPTHYQLAQISGDRGYGYNKFVGANNSNSLITRNYILTQRIATINRKLPDAYKYKDYVKLYYDGQEAAAHWVSSETIGTDIIRDGLGMEIGRGYYSCDAQIQSLMGSPPELPSRKTFTYYVRPILTF